MNTKNQQQRPADPKTDVVESQKSGAIIAYDFGEDAGAGMEDIDKSEYAIPFVRIIQAGSPQAKPASVGGLGMKVGTIFNLGTNEGFDGEAGVEFIPVHRDHNYPEFIPRNEDGSGGGFVGIRAVDDEVVLRLKAEQGSFGKLKSHDGNGEATELGETFYLYGLLVADDVPSQVVIGFSSTQIRKYRSFMTRYMGIQYPGTDGKLVRPPLWAHRWKLTTVYEAKGSYSWYGWRIVPVSEPASTALMQLSDPLYQMGKEFYQSLKSGAAKANYAQTVEATKDDEVPF